MASATQSSSTVSLHTCPAAVDDVPSPKSRSQPKLRGTSKSSTPSTQLMLKWGSRGIRSSILAKFHRTDSPDSDGKHIAPEHRQAALELGRLLDTLHDALKRMDYRRCLLVLTYLLHARHLIHPEVLSTRRCGAAIAALSYSSHVEVATCAGRLLKMWRFGLSEGLRSSKVKELEQKLQSVRNCP